MVAGKAVVIGASMVLAASTLMEWLAPPPGAGLIGLTAFESTLPWVLTRGATVISSDPGIVSIAHGWIYLVIAALAVVLIVMKAPRGLKGRSGLIVVLGILSTALTLWNRSEFSSWIDSVGFLPGRASGRPSIGSGLYVALVASVAIAVGGFMIMAFDAPKGQAQGPAVDDSDVSDELSPAPSWADDYVRRWDDTVA